ncbi:MAG: metal-dependent hydrolase [Mycobacteriales bacterium]
MSWAAHELESYFIQKHTTARVSYLAILLGCLLPDLLTKLPVYGVRIGSFSFKAEVPAEYHRGWPGVGPTHSLLFGVLVAGLVLAGTRNGAWFLGLLLGQWAHALTDTFDSVGTMLFFPFTTQHYTTGMWAYAAQQGRYGDASAYYSSLGGVWDFFWLLMALTGWKVFTREFFFTKVVPNDPTVWGWLRRRFGLSPTAMVALYRAFFVYGACRMFAWFIWSRTIARDPLDWSWGGPFWVDKYTHPAQEWTDFLKNTVVGIVGLSVALWLLWRFVGRPLWNRAERAPAPTRAL